jgi:lysophospholipase L1-like esterase
MLQILAWGTVVNVWIRTSLIVLVSALIGAVAAKIDSRRKLSGPLCFDVPCPHFIARMAAIESTIAQQSGEPVYLAIGDSITESAELERICGRKALNAGIGWATSDTFERHGARLAALSKPDFIVVALGTNDAVRNKTDFRDNMTKLLASLKEYPVVIVPLPGGHGVANASDYNAVLKHFEHLAEPLASVESTDDGVHLAPSTYSPWKASIKDAVEQLVCPK